MGAAIITLTTDFGTGSHYVAEMKGVILSINPEATIVDVTHAIEPQNVRHGALALAAVCGRFPTDSIHVAVIDPGVGTARKIVYARIGLRHFIAPDNGVLDRVVGQSTPSAVYQISRPEHWLPEVSPTFHGRDVMAPVAARLSLGLSPEQLGPPLGQLMRLDWPDVIVQRGRIEGSVARIDTFGNLITDVTLPMLQEALHAPDSDKSDGVFDRPVVVRCGGGQFDGICRTYSQRAESSPIALIGSGGYLELAIVGGSAAEVFHVRVGDAVVVGQ